MSAEAAVATAPRRSFGDVLVGWLVYPAGDLLGQLITGHISPLRIVVMALAGGLIYRYEVPWWFRQLDRHEFEASTIARWKFLRHFVRDVASDRHLNWLGRTVGAILYFNPLWIARHLLFIRLAVSNFSLSVFTPLLASLGAMVITASKSFAVNLPISFAGNYVIQMRIPLRWRFLGSSIFSGILATAYALANRFF